MENNSVGFKKYTGKKSEILNADIDKGDIVFGIDSETDLPYIYHNGVFYSDASELSEALPEIHIGGESPSSEDTHIKVWIDTSNTPILKYKNSAGEWETIATGGESSSSTEIYIGDSQPSEDSDVVVWYDTSGGTDGPETSSTVTWDDVEGKPEFAKVATTGNYNDLINVPDLDLIKESCTVYTYTYEESSYAPFTEEQRESNADAFIKIRQALSDKKDININVIVVYESKENIEYRDCYITDAMYSNTTSGGSTFSVLLGVEIESATIIQDINNPYLSHVKVTRLGNDAEYPSTAGRVEAVVTNTYLATDKDLDKHTTTYIGTEDPSTINSKYNLWVDTTDEEIVFKYKDTDNTWQLLSTGGNGSIEVDTELKETSENPIANKAVYAMAVSVEEGFSEIDENLSKKANTENGLVEGRGFKVTDTTKYYLPNTTVSNDLTIDDAHIIATKADTLNNETLNKKATLYNLYAMDDLTSEQQASNELAFQAVQNGESALYRVYTNDTAYALADVKIVDGPYLEAYVYVSTPNTTDKQATITKYTYTFEQSGEYATSDKKEVVIPSIAKVNELIGSGGTGGSSEVPYFTTYDVEHNYSVIQSIAEGNAVPTLIIDEGGFPYTISNYGAASDNKGLLLYFYGSYESSSVRVVSPEAFLLTWSGEVTTNYSDKPIVELSTDNVITFNTSDDVLKYITIKKAIGAVIRPIIKIHVEDHVTAVADCVYDVHKQPLKVEYNVGSRRYCNTYDYNTGELTNTEDITPTAGESGGGLETRVLYVPQFTAGSELTDAEKAYNAETCQKLMDGTARAFLTDGQVYAYTENIIDLSELMGSGYAVYFDQPSIYAIGGFVIEDGDIVLSLGPISPALVVSKDTPTFSIFSSILMPMLTGKALPTFYIAYEGRNYLATDCVFVEGGLGITYESEFLQLTFVYAEQVFFAAIQFPSFLTIGDPSAVDDNVKWIKNKSVSFLQLPRIKDYFNANMSYIPVYINRYSAQTTYADFGIMRNGALEVWRIHADGTSELVTE